METQFKYKPEYLKDIEYLNKYKFPEIILKTRIWTFGSVYVYESLFMLLNSIIIKYTLLK